MSSAEHHQGLPIESNPTESFLCGLSTSATPLGGLNNELLEQTVSRFSRIGNKLSPVLLDYCSLLSLSDYEAICEKYSVKGMVGTRIALEDDSDLLGELVFVAKNADGLNEISELISKVNAHKHNLKKVKYTDSDISLGNWVYKTMLPEDLNDISDNVTVMISSKTPEMKDKLSEREFGEKLLSKVLIAKGIDSPINSNSELYLEQISFSDEANIDFYVKVLESLKVDLPEWETTKEIFEKQTMGPLITASKATKTVPQARANSATVVSTSEPISVLEKEKMPNTNFGFDVFGGARDVLESKLASNPHLDARKYRDYLEREISILSEIGGAGYYQTIIAFSNYLKERSDHDSSEDMAFIRIRGSAAASIILNLYGVTSSLNDPVEQGLLIERFITSSRIEYPDVDIDIANDQRELFIEFMESNFGENTVAAFVNRNRKASFRELLDKVIALNSSDESTINSAYISKLDQAIRAEIEAYDSQDMHLHNVEEKSKLLAEQRKNNPELDKTIVLAKEYSDWTTTVTSHQSGMIFSPTRDFKLPLLVNSKGGMALESTKPSKLGFVKFDILSSNNVKFLREAAKLLKEQKGIEYEVPNKFDESFFSFFADNTAFLNQMGGSNMRRTLQRVQPKNIYELLMSMALPRPILTKEDRDICYKRRAGALPLPDSAMYKDQRVVDILAPSCGFVLFDEQILELCFKVAGMSEAQADKLRTAIKKNKLDEFHSMRGEFVSGVMSNGGNELMGNEIYQVLEKSVGRYSFPKAHALSYAAIAMEQAWLKQNHPDIALNAVINTFKIPKNPPSGQEFTNFDLLMDEYSNRGIEVVSPSISKSMKSGYRLEDNGTRKVMYAPLEPIFKGVKGSHGEVLLNIIGKIREKKLSIDLTLKNFIDIASPEFRRVLMEEHNVASLSDVSDSFKGLVNRMIYFGAFDEVGFMKSTPVSENRKDSRAALLGVSQMYMEDILSDSPTGKFNDVEIKIDSLDLYDAERTIFKTSFFEKKLDVKPKVEKVNDLKESKKVSRPKP
ncbi:hypothetical protein [Vibrio hepatarius]|uniref:hypothetical protein n=1 Tax=Vibrio hepatarius TaxID=171383 RepID=UPI001C095E30|nr:hypothetical protein [Vibrio hepatarius]MBU2896006.1 hypothetical protein [Vibrio hepatarius]